MSTPPEQPATERKWRYSTDAVKPEPPIPARDISIEEFDALTEEQQEAIRSSPLYELDEEQPESAPASEPGTEATPESEHQSAGDLVEQARTAQTSEELDAIEAQAEGRVTVIDAVAKRRAEIQGA